MTRRVPSQKLVFRVNENALRESDCVHVTEIRAKAARAKVDRGVRPSKEELIALKTEESWEETESILKRMREKRSDPERRNPVAYTQGTGDGIRAAVCDLATMIAVASIAQTLKRWELEDRIAKLEAAAAARHD